jgi:putative flippase GtrA
MPATLVQFLKFAAAGTIGTACHYATLVIWVEALGWAVTPGALAGYCVGALVNYGIARRVVFSSRRPHAAALPRFALTAALGAAINTSIVGLLFHAGLHYLVAQVLATAVVLLWNFVVNRNWTFTE